MDYSNDYDINSTFKYEDEHGPGNGVRDGKHNLPNYGYNQPSDLTLHGHTSSTVGQPYHHHHQHVLSSTSSSDHVLSTSSSDHHPSSSSSTSHHQSTTQQDLYQTLDYSNHHHHQHHHPQQPPPPLSQPSQQHNVLPTIIDSQQSIEVDGNDLSKTSSPSSVINLHQSQQLPPNTSSSNSCSHSIQTSSIHHSNQLNTILNENSETNQLVREDDNELCFNTSSQQIEEDEEVNQSSTTQFTTRNTRSQSKSNVPLNSSHEKNSSRTTRSSRRKNQSTPRVELSNESIVDEKPSNIISDSELLGTQSIFSFEIQEERRNELSKGSKRKTVEFCRFCLTNEIHLQKIRNVKSFKQSSSVKFVDLVPILTQIELDLDMKWTSKTLQYICDECILLFSQFYEFRSTVEQNDELLRNLYCKSKAKSKKLKPIVTSKRSSSVVGSSNSGTTSKRSRSRSSYKDVQTDDDYGAEDSDPDFDVGGSSSRKRARSVSKRRSRADTDQDEDNICDNSASSSKKSYASKSTRKKKRYNSDSDNEDVKSDVSYDDYDATAYEMSKGSSWMNSAISSNHSSKRKSPPTLPSSSLLKMEKCLSQQPLQQPHQSVLSSTSNMDIKSENEDISDFDDDLQNDLEDIYNDDSDIEIKNDDMNEIFSNTKQEETMVEFNETLNNHFDRTNEIIDYRNNVNRTNETIDYRNSCYETSANHRNVSSNLIEIENAIVDDLKKFDRNCKNKKRDELAGGGEMKSNKIVKPIIEDLPKFVEKNLGLLTSSGKLANNYFDIVFKNRNNLQEVGQSVVENREKDTSINVKCEQIDLYDEKPILTDFDQMSDKSSPSIDDEIQVKKKRGRPKNSEIKARKLKKEKKKMREKLRMKKRKIREDLKLKLIKNSSEKLDVNYEGGDDIGNIKFEYDEFFDGENIQLYESSSEEEKDVDDELEAELDVDEDEWICRHCQCKLRSHDLLLRHYTKEHGGYDWASLCHYCGYFNGHKKMIYLHIKDHYAPKKRERKICDICSAAVLHLQQHQKAAHSGICYDCPFCGKGFTRKAELNIHIKAVHLKHQIEKRFICQYCNKDFPFMKYLKRHLRVHSNDSHIPNPYKCNACNATFNNKSLLNTHRNTCPNRELLNRDLLPNQTGTVLPSTTTSESNNRSDQSEEHPPNLIESFQNLSRTLSNSGIQTSSPALINITTSSNNIRDIQIGLPREISGNSLLSRDVGQISSSREFLHHHHHRETSSREFQLPNHIVRELLNSTSNNREIQIGITPRDNSTTSRDLQVDVASTSRDSQIASTARELQIASTARELQIASTARELQIASTARELQIASTARELQLNNLSTRDLHLSNPNGTPARETIQQTTSSTSASNVPPLHFSKFDRPQMYYY